MGQLFDALLLEYMGAVAICLSVLITAPGSVITPNCPMMLHHAALPHFRLDLEVTATLNFTSIAINSTTSPTVAAAVLQAEKQLIQAISDTLAVNIAAAGATVWLGYDILLTLNQEYKSVIPQDFVLLRVISCDVLSYCVYLVKATEDPVKESTVTTDTKIPFNIITIAKVVRPNKTSFVLAFVVSLWANDLKVVCVTVALKVGSLTISPRTPGYPLPGCIASSPKHIKVTLASWTISLAVSSAVVVYFILIFMQFIVTLGINLQSGGIQSFHFRESRKWALIIWLFVRISMISSTSDCSYVYRVSVYPEEVLNTLQLNDVHVCGRGT
ncbi:hypothetical protein OBBRIDRAFT_807363 [Obba rivulosa]|uniref:Uncharacterized protein n=1 Tax=Obba rivulosa TaxID=1052685 RepID=A0A8E2APB5_9APHY|nr:hypothetical protein OBBRIDRAFT_807363 [Obba rivulosa]